MHYPSLQMLIFREDKAELAALSMCAGQWRLQSTFGRESTRLPLRTSQNSEGPMPKQA
jgi:hypothetical protein